jgi:hypothetical protein
LRRRRQPTAPPPLSRPAELLEKNLPLAASRCWQTMVAFSLLRARSKRYSHAARHLHTCLVLARRIKDWGKLEHHITYVARLHRDHGHKYGFWSLVPKEVVPREVAPKAEPTGSSKTAQGDGPGQAASPNASGGS